MTCSAMVILRQIWDLGSFLERWLRDGSGRSFFEAGFTSDGFVEAVEF